MQQPIKVLRGNPTPEELAAALTVVHARAATTTTTEPAPHTPTEWNDPARTTPRPLPHPGPTAWRTTYWPR